MLRNKYLDRINQAFAVTPVVALLGPRQSGKTTIARQYVAQHVPHFAESTNYFDVDDPLHRTRLENPRLALESLNGTIVIDEIQQIPDLFGLIRVLVDRPNNTTRWLILGSASRDLLQQSAQTLAGRISYLDVHPFAIGELGITHTTPLWIRGGFPLAWLADSDAQSLDWRNQYIRTFLERDIPQLGIRVPAHALRRFWMMLAHSHGNVFAAADLARSFDASESTIKHYLDILVGTLMMRRLTPWHENIAKRQVKRPKIYFRDTGILHALLGLGTHADVQNHPILGASREGFALEQIIRAKRLTDEQCYFWGVHAQMELDLLTFQGSRRIGYEIKHTDAPAMRPQYHEIIKHLRLDALHIVYPGPTSYPLAPNVTATSLADAIGE